MSDTKQMEHVQRTLEELDDVAVPAYQHLGLFPGFQPPVLTPLPMDSAERKEIPLWDGVLAYAPAILAEVAKTSQKGNRKHNPGEELHHARGKSSDHKNCIARHLLDYEAMTAAVARGQCTLEDIIMLPGDREVTVLAWLREELGNMSWRVLMFGQQELERLGVAPLAPRARLPEVK